MSDDGPFDGWIADLRREVEQAAARIYREEHGQDPVSLHSEVHIRYPQQPRTLRDWFRRWRNNRAG